MDKQTLCTMFSSDKDCWETPQALFNALNAQYHFTLDAAASDINHKVDKYYTAYDDGLSKDWGGETVWCNPPYGTKETGEWTRKAYEESSKPNTTVVMLLPARTDRRSFHKYIYNKSGVSVRFLQGRLAFEINGEPIRNDKNCVMKAPFPSMIVEFKVHETLKSECETMCDLRR